MRSLLLLSSILLLVACKPSTPAKKFISATSLIEQQIRAIDTSLYSIKKYTTVDSLPADTSYIPREDFRKEVSAFFNLPDLSDPKVAADFNEETRFDDLMKRVIISYTPADPAKQSFQRIELFVEPNLDAGDQVRTILATRRSGDRNGFEQEELIWQMDRSCTSIRTTQKPGGFEQIRTIKLSWNE
jgi:hypothetical protein